MQLKRLYVTFGLVWTILNKLASISGETKLGKRKQLHTIIMQDIFKNIFLNGAQSIPHTYFKSAFITLLLKLGCCPKHLRKMSRILLRTLYNKDYGIFLVYKPPFTTIVFTPYSLNFLVYRHYSPLRHQIPEHKTKY